MGVRLETALAIRDAALGKIRTEGQFQEIKNFGPALVWPDTLSRRAPLSMLLRTPFQKIPGPSVQARKKAILAGLSLKGQNLAFGLDIWTSEGKALNIEWDEGSKVNLRTFKRGIWENTVLAWKS